MQILLKSKIKTREVENHLKHSHFVIALNITSRIAKKKKKKCISLINSFGLFILLSTGYWICFIEKKCDVSEPVVLVNRAGNEKCHAS